MLERIVPRKNGRTNILSPVKDIVWFVVGSSPRCRGWQTVICFAPSVHCVALVNTFDVVEFIVLSVI